MNEETGNEQEPHNPIDTPWPPEVRWGKEKEYRKLRNIGQKPAVPSLFFIVHFYSIRFFPIRFVSREVMSGSFPWGKGDPNKFHAGPREKARVNLLLLLTRYSQVSVSADGQVSVDPYEACLPRLNPSAHEDIRQDLAAMAPGGETWLETPVARYEIKFTTKPDGGFCLNRISVKPLENEDS